VTAATGTVEPPGTTRQALAAFARRNGWPLSLLLLLALLFVFTRLIQPFYGIPGIQGLAISVLPLALAAAAQAIVVISGGIDLSIGSMMALNSVVVAVLMKDQGEEFAVLAVIAVLVLGAILGAINGVLIVLTRVADIIVTLAMLFVWAGCALLILGTPGGASAQWLGQLILGSIGIGIPQADILLAWIPKAAVVLFLVVAVIWLPLRRSRLGLSMYAIGSNRVAALRSGVDVDRTKVLAYAVGGLFAALAGISLTATTGLATPVPGPYTLLSVAAVVLGGVSLAGGRGGVFGPILAVLVLELIRVDMIFLGFNPNLAVVAQGAILIGVVMAGSLIAIRRERA